MAKQTIEVLIEGELKYGEFLEKMKTPYLKVNQYNSLIQLCRNLIEKYDIDIRKSLAVFRSIVIELFIM